MLDYRQPHTTQTLAAGLSEYHAARADLVRGRGASPAAQEFFRCHDVAHVIFGCDTTLRDEAAVKMWSFFGTTAGLALLRAYRLPESQEIYETIRPLDVLVTGLRAIVLVPRVLWRCTRMHKRWPWSAFESYLERPLTEIRREFGIRPL